MSTSVATIVPDYNLKASHALLQEISELRSIDGAIAWDFRARQEIEAIERYLHLVDDFRRKLQIVRAAEIEEHGRRSFFTRVFSSREKLVHIDSTSAALELRVGTLVNLREELQASVDKTPDSREEQKNMLKDLKLLKKELLQEKREVNEAMRQIRVQSRQATNHVAAGFTGLLLSTPSSRQWSRLSIRLQKESSLAPHEGSKTSIERQILAVDRAIHWIERFR